MKKLLAIVCFLLAGFTMLAGPVVHDWYLKTFHVNEGVAAMVFLYLVIGLTAVFVYYGVDSLSKK